MDNPKAFISYAWTSPAHNDWVETLSRDLHQSGIEVQLDKWHLKLGHDTTQFMESIIKDQTISHVIMICDRKYKEKADNREAGAGIEAQIITQEFYDQASRAKYLAVIREKDSDGKPLIPIFAGGKLYLDFTDDAEYATKLEELIRWVYDKPLKVPPPLGKRPHWLDETPDTGSPTRLLALSAIQSIKKGERHLLPTLKEYLNKLSNYVSEIPDIQVNLPTATSDAVKAMDHFLQQRSEYIDVVSALGMYPVGDEAYQAIHSFFEELVAACLPSRNVNSYNPNQFDHKKFIAYELFMLTAAIYINNAKWAALIILIHQEYVSPAHTSARPSQNFTFFYHDNLLLKIYFEKLKQRSDMVLSKYLFVRTRNTPSDADIMQADLLLYLAYIFSKTEKSRGVWWPECYGKSGTELVNFPVFLRAKSRSYFEKISPVIGISSINFFKEKIKEIDQKGGPFSGMFYFSLPVGIGAAIDLDAVGTSL